MQEITLKYGCNPNQSPARIFVQGGPLPVQVLGGQPGYINFLDALHGWQLVQQLQKLTGLAAAASFKHVSPAGAALGLPLPDVLKKAYFVPENLQLSPLACAYARARGADRMCSYGDFVALSAICDESTAALLQGEVSDGVIAPGYTQRALEILRQKRGGKYTILQIDENYVPKIQEQKDVFGITFEQSYNSCEISEKLLTNLPSQNKNLTPQQKQNLLLALITLKYTQSNSVCYVKNGQTIGVGAGQQSRIHCTRLAGDKADNWHLRQHPQVLALPFLPGLARANRDNAIDLYLSDDADDVLCDGAWQELFTQQPAALDGSQKRAFLKTVGGVALGSDAFFPFGDNIERARRSGVDCIAQPGGSVRDAQVIAACNKYNIAMAFTGLRLFTH